MTSKSERELKRRLKAIGLSNGAIKAAWPEWWSSDADASPSAKLELNFSVARKLGIDPRSLLDAEGLPRFVWRDETRFKNLSGESDAERAAISSFGRALGALLAAATAPPENATLVGALALRRAVLRSQPFVRLVDLISISWSVGIPVVHLRVFPRRQKRMAAMVVRIGSRSAILLAKDSYYPPHAAFYIAHELGHLYLKHVGSNTAIADLEYVQTQRPLDDPEENEADRFGLELLTGSPEPKVLTDSPTYNAPGLAAAVLQAGHQLQIEPGTLALCFGFSTNLWPVVNSAMRFIYTAGKPVWKEVNRIAAGHINLELLPVDARSYLAAVLDLEHAG